MNQEIDIDHDDFDDEHDDWVEEKNYKPKVRKFKERKAQ